MTGIKYSTLEAHRMRGKNILFSSIVYNYHISMYDIHTHIYIYVYVCMYNYIK